ncbi:MAG: ABC transporter ATP-binding protein [Albidovulum sp.]|nr:ABC transporter ATP-binding protein [Albidovulum sp.]MDE0530045.1 ABC transporter ATP-binding protein [Albidovulum sp.]
MIAPTLDIRDLRLTFSGLGGSVDVLHGISLSINREERVALVGESGSGKSVTARSVLGLLQSLRGTRISGDILFEGTNLESMDESRRRQLRGTRMSMIFQDPVSSLNPVYRIGVQFREVLARSNPGIDAAEARDRAAEILSEVSIGEPGRVLESFPFQLSGGMNQRVMIAMALVNEPALLVADEPGTALDVTVQDQTLRLMHRLVQEHRTSVLFISHNLGIVREFTDRLYVIYRGRIVEEGPTGSVFRAPGHPYTRALLAAVPRITRDEIPEFEADPGKFGAPKVVHGPAGNSA